MTLTHSQAFGPYPKPVGTPDPLLEAALGTFIESLDASSIAPPEELKEGRYRIAMRAVLKSLGLNWTHTDWLPTEAGDGYEVYVDTGKPDGQGILRNVTYAPPGILITDATWTNEHGDDLDNDLIHYWRRPRTDNLPAR